MAISKPSHNQASPVSAIAPDADPAMPVSIRLSTGDFRLILHALYLFSEREVGPDMRRLRIRLGLITMRIHEEIAREYRQSRTP